MAPLTKDAVESGSAAPETAVSQSTSQPASQAKPGGGGHLRSDAVSLEVPVKVHGSRVKEVARGATPHTEPFEEPTTTMIVFPQGGVLRMAASVAAGQMLVLTNLKTKQDAICRVLKVRAFPNMQSYVEVEFTQPQKGYWGVYFAAEGSAPGSSKPAPVVAPPPSIAPPPPEPKQKITSEISWAPAASVPASKPPEPIKQPPTQAKEVQPAIPALPPPPPAPAKPVSAFASIGTKEDVQIAADSTREVKPAHVAATIEKEIRAAAPAKPAAAAEELPPPPATTLSIEELRGDEDAISSVLASLDSDEKSPAAKAADTGKASVAQGFAVPAFGARLDLGVGTSAGQTAEPGQNWMLIAASIAVLFLAVGGGVWYFRTKATEGQPVQQPIVSQQAAPQASAPSQPQRAVTQPAQSSPAQLRPAPERAVQASAPPVTVAASANEPRTSKASSAASTKSSSAPSEPAPTVVAEQQPPQNAGPNPLATAMDAHPVSSQRAVTQNEAPSVDSAASSSAQPGELPGIGSSSIAAPPPPAPETAVKVGGKVQAPKLISSAMPVYPSVAKQAHVEGDVVIDTQIDKNGSVIHMKAISGPVVLRQAALDAVRRWKYQPSTLDGQAVSIEMLVTVKFHL